MEEEMSKFRKIGKDDDKEEAMFEPTATTS